MGQKGNCLQECLFDSVDGVLSSVFLLRRSPEDIGRSQWATGQLLAAGVFDSDSRLSLSPPHDLSVYYVSLSLTVTWNCKG